MADPTPTDDDKTATLHLLKQLDAPWWLEEKYTTIVATAYALGRNVKNDK